MSGKLNHSPAKITLELLVSAGLAEKVSTSSPDWMVFLNKDPDIKNTTNANFQQQKIVSVYDSAGIVDDRLQNTGRFQESHGVQIVLRINGYQEQEAYTKAKTIQDYFDLEVNRYTVRVTDTVETTYLVHSYNRTSDIIRMNRLGEDNSVSGLRISMNFLMFVTKLY